MSCVNQPNTTVNVSSSLCALECQIHKGSPIMFVCLDNSCKEKLHCFKCCQQHRNKHNFVKFTDFLHNLDYFFSFPDPQSDSSQQINSTQQFEGDQNEIGQKKQQQMFDRKTSVQEEDNLVSQCVKGMNTDFRNGKVWEECESEKDNLKGMQIQYIDSIFDKHLQDFILMLEKGREQIISKYSEYVDNMLNVNNTITKASENRACKLVLEISKSSCLSTQAFNESLTQFHSGEIHIQLQKERIVRKIAELNSKIDEFFAQVQNRITFSLNSCNNVFLPKQTNQVSKAAIQKIFAQNQLQKQQIPKVDFRFQLRQQNNNNNAKTTQNQLSQQSSLLTSMQNSTIGGLGSRISFRIKNMAQKKLDNFLSLSPSHSSGQKKPSQGFQINPSQVLRFQYSNMSQQSKSGSPRSQQITLFKGIDIQVKQQNLNSSENLKGVGDKDIGKQIISQQNEDAGNTLEMNPKLISQSILRKSNINENTKNLVIHIQNGDEQMMQNKQTNNQFIDINHCKINQLYASQSLETDLIVKPNPIISLNIPVTHSVHHSCMNQVKGQNKSPNKKNSGNKIGQEVEYFPPSNEENFLKGLKQFEENSKQPEHKHANAEVVVNRKSLFDEYLTKSALLKHTNQIKNVVQNQKQVIKQNISKDNLIHVKQTYLQQKQLFQQPQVIVSSLFPEETTQSLPEIEQFEEQQQENQFVADSISTHNNNYILSPQANYYISSLNSKGDEEISRKRLQSSHQQGKLSRTTVDN